MSNHNTMNSNTTDTISQQQAALRQTYGMQHPHTMSMTSANFDPATGNLQAMSNNSQSTHYPGVQQQTVQQLGQYFPSPMQQSYMQQTYLSPQSAAGQSSSLPSKGTILNNSHLANYSGTKSPQLRTNSNLTFNNFNNTTQTGNLMTNGVSGAAIIDNITNNNRTNSMKKQFQPKNSLTNASVASKSKSLIQNQKSSQADPKSPLVILIPTSAQPTETLSARFSAWRHIIRSIIVYLTENASIQDEIVRQQLRLSHAVQFTFFNVDNQHQPTTQEDKYNQKFFLPLGSGSIQDLPSVLNHYHEHLAAQASKGSRELTNEVIPRLEDLRRDLLVKIKEIKTLQSDFRNSCAKELQQTKQDMKHYIDALKEAKYGTPAKDPYLLKIALERQIKKQLNEENFLHEAFDNLETSGAALEKVVVMEIQNALTIYARMVGQQSQLVFDKLISKLDTGFFSVDPQYEWEAFIARDPNFLLPNLPMRNYKEITYKYQYDPFIYEIKSGWLERRSKFLKSYSKGFYVLTSFYLHEFKSADRKRDTIPVMSLPLQDCTVSEHAKKGSTDAKFILHGKQNGIIRRGHNWVFKAESHESMLSWYKNIIALTSSTDYNQKYKYVKEKLNLDENDRPKLRAESAQNRKSGDLTIADESADFEINNHNQSSPVMRTHEEEGNSPARTGTPKLDDQTHTNTSASSFPDTNDSHLHETIPNVYVQTPFSDVKY